MWIRPRGAKHVRTGLTKLTKRMREVLEKADLEKGEINDVPMGTMYALERRSLIPSDWRRIRGGVIQTTGGGMFPRYRHVKLTPDGLRASRTLQGLRADF